MRRFLAMILCVSLLVIPVRADTQTKYAVLTFDDGPSGRFTRRLLDGLKERGVKATFLLCGYRIREYPEEAQRIADEGHEIGIHGYSHDCMCCMTREQVDREILDTAALLPEGAHPIFLRPPGGKCGDAMSAAAKCQGLAVLHWSLDSRDWATKDAETLVRRVADNVSDGDVILMHDMYDSSVDAALAIIDLLTERGYCFVTATQLVQLRGIELRPGTVYRSFPPEAA